MCHIMITVSLKCLGWHVSQRQPYTAPPIISYRPIVVCVTPRHGRPRVLTTELILVLCIFHQTRRLFPPRNFCQHSPIHSRCPHFHKVARGLLYVIIKTILRIPIILIEQVLLHCILPGKLLGRRRVVQDLGNPFDIKCSQSLLGQGIHPQHLPVASPATRSIVHTALHVAPQIPFLPPFQHDRHLGKTATAPLQFLKPIKMAL